MMTGWIPSKLPAAAFEKQNKPTTAMFKHAQIVNNYFSACNAQQRT
jgi:hypothetical protein